MDGRQSRDEGQGRQHHDPPTCRRTKTSNPNSSFVASKRRQKSAENIENSFLFSIIFQNFLAKYAPGSHKRLVPLAPAKSHYHAPPPPKKKNQTKKTAALFHRPWNAVTWKKKHFMKTSIAKPMKILTTHGQNTFILNIISMLFKRYLANNTLA